MINTEAIKSKIISFIERNGPSLPIQISKEIGMNSIFTSAFLSELLDNKKIKTSSLRVGGTSLYLILGQEEQLEKFYKYLHPKEAEAFEILKKNRILKDSEQEPAIRVALRAIKDFAISFKDNEEIYWRYLTVEEPEIVNIFNSKTSRKQEIETKQESPSENDSYSNNKPLIEPEILKIEEKQKPQRKRILKEKQIAPVLLDTEITGIETKQTIEFKNPLAAKPIEKPRKEKPRSDFVAKTIVFLNKNNFRIVEEKDYKTKEYNCIVEVNSDLGKILFLTNAKDKKTPSDADLQELLSKAQSIPLPALFLYTGNLGKKALEYEKKYYSILKTRKIV